MPSFIDTDPKITPIEIIIDPSTFTALGSVEIMPTPAFRNHVRLVDVTVFKEVAFDNAAAIALGSGTTSGNRETMATSATVAAGTLGVSKPVAWMAAGGFGEKMVAGDTRLFAYLTGGLPTVGRIRLVLSVIYLSPRPLAT